MRFKLDENLPVELAAELRTMGYDTDTVADEGLCGEADPAIVEAATVGDRILLTLDKGIADVRSRRGAGVVLFRPDSGRPPSGTLLSRWIRDYLRSSLAEFPDEVLNLINHTSHAIDGARNRFSESHFGSEAGRWLAVYSRDIVNVQIRLLLHFM